jgi:hypothetical protein
MDIKHHIKQVLKDLAGRAMLGPVPADEVAATLGTALAEIQRLENAIDAQGEVLEQITTLAQGGRP